ncbi:MAG: pyridoxal-phosphate dependent enzyme [Gammaproteobacteria bacterium]|nr:pyridoxal-phosphate dependent enzyme [Gammaproteobacteria bacterium]
MSDPLPTFDDVLAAAARIAPHAHVTPVLRSRTLDALVGAQLHFKCEQLQRVGAFKFRGACNAVWSLTGDDAARGVVTHSSGNHGAALALAARTRGIACHVVVPEGAVRSKLVAIQGYGATVHPCAPTLAAREAECAAVQRATGAILVHPYTDPRVIAGQGTAALELLNACAAPAGQLHALIVPVGGGGLAAGSALAAAALAPECRVFVAEPSGAADTFASLQRGERITEFVPDTVCDGLRGTLGAPNFALLRAHRVEALVVDDAHTVAAMRLLWARIKQLVEPSSATVLAALLRYRERFAGQRVGVILSGGNVDLDTPAQRAAAQFAAFGVAAVGVESAHETVVQDRRGRTGRLQ